jgi:hypothetical protein
MPTTPREAPVADLRERLDDLVGTMCGSGDDAYDRKCLAIAVYKMALDDAAQACDGMALECCGSPQVGAEYMGQQEIICCGCPEPSGKTPDHLLWFELRVAVEEIATVRCEFYAQPYEVFQGRTPEQVAPLPDFEGAQSSRRISALFRFSPTK